MSTIEERDDVELDLDESEEGGPEADAVGKKPKRARFVIEDDNQGTTIRLRAKLTVSVQKVIDRMYRELHREPNPGDRLTRVSDGSNVFESAEQTVEEYIGDGPLRQRIRWSYAGVTGGA